MAPEIARRLLMPKPNENSTADIASKVHPIWSYIQRRPGLAAEVLSLDEKQGRTWENIEMTTINNGRLGT